MSNAKRYYWLKLQDDFFGSKRIKKLRKLAGGDTYTIIYLKMQLLAMKQGGVLVYTGLEPTFAEELALDIDEDDDNVAVTVSYLLSCGLLETEDEKEYFLPYAVLNTGSEGSSAKRMREHRERKALQSNNDVTPPASLCDGEIEIEKEIEIDKEIEGEERADEPPSTPTTKKKKAKKKPFVPPTLEDIKTYCKERNNDVDPKKFFDYFEAADWIDSKGKPVLNWKQKVITWEGTRKENNNGNGKHPSGSKPTGAAQKIGNYV